MLPASCLDKSEEGETYIELQSEEVLLDSRGGSVELSFKTSAEWTAVPYHTVGNWCTVNKTSGGKGSSTLIITASSNESYYERNTAIKIQCKDISRKIVITQKQKDAILVSSNKVEIGQEGGTRPLTVTANVDYECIVESGSDWISVVEEPKTKGIDTCGFYLEIAPNKYFEKRQGLVVVRSEQMVERIDVYQTGSVPFLLLSENEHVAKSSGDTVKIEVASNCDYLCELPELDWIYETESGLQSLYTHYFALKPNDSPQSRTVTVVFTNLYNGNKENLIITQLPKNAITTARSEYNLNTSKKEILLRLNSIVDFEVDIPVDWIHLSKRDSSKPYAYYDYLMVVDENKTQDMREAYVTFYNVESAQRVIVRQDGRSDYLKVVIRHYSPELAATVSGGKVYGYVDWGDGNRDDLILSNKHSYADTTDRCVTLDCWGVNSFKLPSLTNISQVEIFVNGKQNGSAESFVVDRKNWDN